MYKEKAKKISIVFVVLTMLFMSTTEVSLAKPVKENILRYAVSLDLSSGLYYETNHPDDNIQMAPMYETLMRYDKNGVPQPFLAESIEANPDNLTYRLKLKEGIFFSDGSKLDAEVCAFCLQLYKEKGIKSGSFCQTMESFEVVDEYTVDIHLNQWDSTIPAILARDDVSAMISKKAYQTKGEEYLRRHPVCTGPFILDTWERDVKKTYIKNKNYWQGEPLLDKIEVFVYSDTLVAQAALERGDVDIYYCTDYNLASTMAKKGFKVVDGTYPTRMPILAFNSANAKDPFSDLRVRRAVAHAIDQQAICDVVFKGYMTPTNQFAPKDSLFYNNRVDGYKYNIQKAKKLLAEAGYPNGFKTKLYGKNEEAWVDCMTVIQALLAEIGIDVELVILEGGDFGTALCGWDKGMFLHITALPPAVNLQAYSMFRQGLSGIVFGLTSIQRSDKLHIALVDSVMAKSEEQAHARMHDAQKIMIDEECLFWPIGMGEYTYIKSPKLHDDGIYEISTSGHTLHKAWVEK